MAKPRPSRSKTGRPECSEAVRAWKTTGMAHAIALVLAQCRALARAQGQAALHEAAGVHVAKARALVKHHHEQVTKAHAARVKPSAPAPKAAPKAKPAPAPKAKPVLPGVDPEVARRARAYRARLERTGARSDSELSRTAHERAKAAEGRRAARAGTATVTPREANLARAEAYAASKGVEVRRDYEFPSNKSDALGLFHPWKDKQFVLLNRDAGHWDDPAGHARQMHQMGWISSDHPMHVIHHEVGHALHFRALGHERYSRLSGESLTDSQQALVRAKVGEYASGNPMEFVAEVHAGLVAGRAYDAKVMDLFHRFGGPLP